MPLSKEEALDVADATLRRLIAALWNAEDAGAGDRERNLRIEPDAPQA